MATLINATYTAASAAGSLTPNIGAHQAGDRIGVIPVGKYNTTTIPASANGFTRIGSFGGGTGASGNDTGTMWGAGYWREATGSAHTLTLTAGATPPNSWGAWAFVFRLDAGETWQDSIASLTHLTFSDTSTASPLTGTTGAPATSIEATDLLLFVGGIPTDLGSALDAGGTMTSTGLSGGTITQATTQYGEASLGTDCASVWMLWSGFTGTSTSGVAVSVSITGATNHSGVGVVTPLRVNAAAEGYDVTVPDALGITDEVVAELITPETAPTKWCTVDGVPNGTSVTVASTATGSGTPLDSNGSGAGTCVSTTSGKIRGTAAAQFDGTAQAVWRELHCPDTETSLSARVYFRINSSLSIVTNNVAFMGLRSETDTGVAQAVLTTTKNLLIQNAAGITILDAGVLPDGEYVVWIGAVVGATTSTGTIRAKLRDASDDSIVAAVDQIGNANSGTVAVGLVRFGKPSSSGNLTALVLDEFALLAGNATEISRVAPGYNVLIEDSLTITDTAEDQVLVVEDTFNDNAGLTDEVVAVLHRGYSNTGIPSEEAFGTPAVTAGTTQTFTPTGIASSEAFGTPTENAVLDSAPTAIPSAEAFGTANVNVVKNFNPTAIASGEAFGTADAQVAQTSAPTGIASAEAFGTTTVQVGGTSSPTAIASAEAFGSPEVDTTVNVTPTAIASGEAFGTPTENAVLNSAPTGISSGEVFGTTAFTGSVTASLTAIASAEAFGTPAMTAVVTISPTGISSGELFGSPSMTSSLTVTVTGISTAEAFGTSLANVIRTAIANAIASGEAFGTATITTVLNVSPTGIVSEEAFGDPAGIYGNQYSGVSIPSAEAFGVPQVVTLVNVTAIAISTAEAFGVVVANVKINATVTGIPSQENFGTPQMTSLLNVSPVGIPGVEAFGNPSMSSSVTVSPVGVPSAEALGVPTLALGALAVAPVGISTQEAFGVLTYLSVLTVSPVGFADPDGFGSPAILTTVNIYPISILTAEEFGAVLANAIEIFVPEGSGLSITVGAEDGRSSVLSSPLDGISEARNGI